MKFFDYFQSLGFSQKEAEIYLALYKLGTQPASVVASYINMERTHVYKILVEFARKDLVSITEKGGIKNFFIPDITVLRRYVENERTKYEKMHNEFDAVEIELQSHKQWEMTNTPKITLYEGGDGVKNCYENIANELIKNNYRSCKLFASNTLTSRSGKSDTINQYASEFLTKMETQGLHIDALLGNGIWLMESIGQAHNIDELRNLPATNESIQVFVAGGIVYILIFREIPFAMKIASEELAGVLYFLLEKVGKM